MTWYPYQFMCLVPTICFLLRVWFLSYLKSRDEQFVPDLDLVSVLNRTEFKNMGQYLVLQIYEIRESVPPVPVPFTIPVPVMLIRFGTRD